MKQNFFGLRSRSCPGTRISTGRCRKESAREGREATHPVLVGPVEKESEHLVAEQSEWTRRNPVVRDAHQRNEVEDACSGVNVAQSKVQCIGERERLMESGRTEPSPPSLPPHALERSEGETGGEGPGVDGGSKGNEERELLAQFGHHALSCTRWRSISERGR